MAKRTATTTAARSTTAFDDAPPPETQALARRRPLVDDTAEIPDPPVDRRTGELTYEPDRIHGSPTEEPDVEMWARNETWSGLSTKPVTAEQATALLEPVRDDELLIKPDQFGAVYLSHPGYRRRLNAAFRPGGWGLRRISPVEMDATDHMMYADFALYAEGRCLAVAKGEQKYMGAGGGSGENDKMTKGDAMEGVISNALMRCCKMLGMAMECWDRDFTDRWRNTYCFRVWKGGKPAWRRMVDPPAYNETGIMDDSPNQDKYSAPPQRGAGRGGSSQGAGRSQEPEPRRAAPPAGEQPKGDPNKKISDKQKGFFWSQVKKAGLDPDDVAEYLKATFKITASGEMTNEIMDKALAWVRDPNGVMDQQ